MRGIEMDDEIRALLDRQQILDAFTRYAIGMDHGDRALFASAWTDDAVLVCEALRLDLHGLEAILRYYDQGPGAAPKPPAAGGSVRMVANPLVEISGDTARCTSELAAFRYIDDSVKPYAIGYYDDELVRGAGDWRLSRRVMVVNPIGSFSSRPVER
jgi:hypothetical protein